MDFMNRPREYSDPGELVRLSATFGQDNQSLILCVTRAQDSSSSTSAEELKPKAATEREDSTVMFQ